MSILDKCRSPRLAAMLAPILLLAILRLATPAEAPASEFNPESGASLNPAKLAETLHPRALAAGAYARLALQQPLGPSPFAMPASATATAPESSAPEAAPIPEFIDPQPSLFALTSVMASNAGAVIVLNGRLFRLNDTPAPGWTITHIDPAARTATLDHEAGRRLTLTLTKPMATPR